jgi:hypothetical protein
MNPVKDDPASSSNLKADKQVLHLKANILYCCFWWYKRLM